MHELIQAYQTIFPNRHSAETLQTMDQLIALIRIELLDELTHPRVRKNTTDKLELAYGRIDSSQLNSYEKQRLKALYKEVFQIVNS